MQVTKIEKQIKRDKRYSIFIDNEFSFGLSEVDLLYYKLREGDQITLEKYNIILEEVVFSSARDKALKFLSYKARTKKEVIEKLKTYDYTEEVIDRVINLLEKYDYINDEKYAKALIKYLANSKKFGIKRIKFELEQKGIKKNIICELLEEADFDETESALLLIRKKLRNKELDDKEKIRVYNFLLRKGFNNAVIKEAFYEYARDDEV